MDKWVKRLFMTMFWGTFFLGAAYILIAVSSMGAEEMSRW